ncbi:adenine nucleotide alpha hydrolases-like protein [Hypoxylon sp. FL1284]|nr:adenine nucleotide alpha hydrolases-like protein [Hypoxylon sp. FL1284]
MAADKPLNVVALISGGKDSFYSILHCLANGHRVVALANLHPPTASASRAATASEANHGRISPGGDARQHKHERAPSPGGTALGDGAGDAAETDLNSFMYQTVGHQVVPLYARATGLPLFRRPILGSAVDHGVSYRPSRPSATSRDDEEDETESLVPLLRAVLAAHPEVNALCAGAILSTYQRTRVESVALRLGLVPLAYLWQFPVLPVPSTLSSTVAEDNDAQLLRDMAATGLEARLVKVASAGLGEDLLWADAASAAGASRIGRALRRFGGGGSGSVLGEGGEFETLVVDGPRALFRGRVVVREEDRKVVREGGGCAWLSIRRADVEMKDGGDEDVAERVVAGEGEGGGLGVRIPALLDGKFEMVLEELRSSAGEVGVDDVSPLQTSSSLSSSSLPVLKPIDSTSTCQNWYFAETSGSSVASQTQSIVTQIQARLRAHNLPATAITNSVVALRRMADFPTVNDIYGALFPDPDPPARVTVSCGDLLPAGCHVTVLVAAQLAPAARERRRGLHVQSRSYWAPANIGPYSQAVAYPLLPPAGTADPGSGSSSPLAVSVAGQIPLVPAAMALPPAGDGPQLQVALALQHLWRVGAATRVRWWTGATAYLARPRGEAFGGVHAMRCAALVGAAWRAAHARARRDDEDEDEGGPDLWDRKYNPTYMTYGNDGGGGDGAERLGLPDWEVLKGFDDDDGGKERQNNSPVPFVFSAEVDELPRSAAVEWHAHLGLADLDPGAVRLHSEPARGPGAPNLHHVVVESAGRAAAFVQTVAVFYAQAGPDKRVLADATPAVRASLARLLTGADDALPEPDGLETAVPGPKLSYVDPARVALPADPAGRAVVACGSLWDSRVRGLDMVSIFETRWGRT